MLETPASLRRRRILLGTLATSAAPAGRIAWAGNDPAASSAAARLGALIDRHFEALLDADPFWASRLGIATQAQASRIAIAIAPAHLRRIAALHRTTRSALRGIDRRELAEPERIGYDVLEFRTREQIAQLRFPDHLLPLSQLGEQPPFELATAAENGLCAFASVADYEHHRERLAMLPDWNEQAIVNFREGVRRGIVHPRPIIERLLPMLHELAPGAAEKSPYYAPLRLLPQGIPAAERERIGARYRELIEQRLTPSFARLADVVEREVLPQARNSTGWSALPDGKAWYAQWVQTNTGTALTPDEIHALGLREVQRLRDKMALLQAQYGFQGVLSEFLVWHDKRPEARPFKTEQEVLGAYAQLNRRISEKLPTLFGRAPKAPLEIRPEPELTRNTASDHYSPPTADGSRPGVYFAVIPDASAYATPRMASLFLHEGQPGHHYQVALAQELPLTKLQRFQFDNAFGEGWALYAETLGYELGLYDDPNWHVGHLGMAMMRAVRLVVDTGMHAKHWTREQALRYFMEQTGFDERGARAQIERYMVWPGQALSYSIGRIKIEQLRDRAHQAIGARFSLSAFHDQVVGSGSLPLGVLEAKIARWIRAVVTA